MNALMTVPAEAGTEGSEFADWAAIKEAYERGFDPLVVIGRRHGVGYRAISAHAYRHKWRRLALEGASATTVEVAVGAMAVDLQRALKRQLKGLSENLRKEMAKKGVKASAKLDTVNATIRALMSATGIVEKVLKINERRADRVEHLRTKDGGDDPRAELERRLAGFFDAVAADAASGAADA